jgi:hypothetical protein
MDGSISRKWDILRGNDVQEAGGKVMTFYGEEQFIKDIINATNESSSCRSETLLEVPPLNM